MITMSFHLWLTTLSLAAGSGVESAIDEQSLLRDRLLTVSAL